MIRYLSAGESHGRGLIAIIEGIPAGLNIRRADIDRDLARRQKGYGRGARMQIEKDKVTILSGVRHGRALGSPISLWVRNRDWVNWKRAMTPEPVSKYQGRVTRPRPGHVDLAGWLKYSSPDIRDVLERASARETVARVALAGLAKLFLARLGIRVVSYVVEIGPVAAKGSLNRGEDPLSRFELAEGSEVRTFDPAAEKKMKAEIDKAKEKGDSLGGVFELVALGVPPGLGSHIQWDKRLDGRLAQALMSIPAIKGVEIGLGFEASRRPGSKVHDEICYQAARAPWPFYRPSNNAGGLEGGVSNGEPLVIRAAMKPISTLRLPLGSVDIETKEPFLAHVERADVCAVPAASVVGEAMLALELAVAASEKFGGDSIIEVERNYQGYLASLSES